MRAYFSMNQLDNLKNSQSKESITVGGREGI